MSRKSVSWMMILALLLGALSPLASTLTHPAPVRADESSIALDGLREASYIQIASDPSGDLASSGPASWTGTQWTDLTALYVAADATNLYVYVDLPGYFYNAGDTGNDSSGQIGLALDVDGIPNSGGTTDGWNTAIIFNFTHIDGVNASDTLLPDYLIRGDVSNDGGWTELREWNGNWDTGTGSNWGGLSGGLIGAHVAYSYTQGVEFAIPLADIGNPDPYAVHLQFFATQNGGSKGAYDTLPSDDQTTGWDDPTTQTRLVSVPLATDVTGDLFDSWSGIAWMDAPRMHIWADQNALHLFIASTHYSRTVSAGQIGLAIDTQPGGGVNDAWNGTGLTYAYTTTWQNLGFTPLVTTTLLRPDYLIRGNVFNTLSGGDAGNGWTEFRIWNGNWDTGSGVDWGGIGDTGQPSQPNSHVAWSDGEGLRLTIPLTQIGVADGDTINLQFFGTQSGWNQKGAFDTLPSDDQATGWDDPTVQQVFATYTIPAIASPAASHDNDIWWSSLYHDSRDPLYRTPGGAVETGAAVTLRLRAAANDLTAARVRLWNDRTNTQTLWDMHVSATDGTYDWWEVTLPASVDPTIYWYRFIVIDGTDMDYYEDDAARTMGVGQAYDETPDRGWQITMYDPTYQTPDWIKNAVVYQVFTDRFRDGDETNDTPAGSFFYDDTTIQRSNAADWNTQICDPRDSSGPCPGVWSQNFYGGDLQGIIDQLPYLNDLGVNALYLNPIFESPSNHKYDATDYMHIDDNFGDLSTFITLTQQAELLGMHVILDGVFNHVSSDSIYFDRYHRYPELGACESQNSPYRSWFYFLPADTPGEGPCVGDDGAPGGATYVSWFGYDSLPKLRANAAQVRSLIWSNGTDSVGPYWMQWADGWRLDVGGDVDPGVTNDPTNDYWEGFRDATRVENPDTYIVGEEWGNSTPWLLGQEWDASMNYQFGSAIMGFWRDTPFTDNDHNAGSSAGVIAPLAPSQLEERLRYLEERYPPEAFYAMMNLLDSHDTNRALFMLDENAATGTDDSLLDNPNYDWSDALTRLQGVALLQFTLPGAPTIYYGDEVGLVGPTSYVVYGPGDAKWEDDPYNRVPYPWLDASGMPYYTHLQSGGYGQATLRDYYALLAATRNAHAALRTGSFDTLLIDDNALVYAYGRKLADSSDAAVVIANRDTATQTVALDVSGYLPVGATLMDVLNGDAEYTVAGDGSLTVADVPAMSGALLVLSGTLGTPPAAVTDLAVTDEGDGELTLAWSAADGADSYDLYRSLTHGGGYAIVDTITETTYIDTGLQNAMTYYYVVVSRDDTTRLTSDDSNEASGMPHYFIGWANLSGPAAITHTIGITPTEPITGQVWISGVTGGAGATAGLLAQVGYGATAAHPYVWTHWVDAAFSHDLGNNDVFSATLTPEATGDYHYVYRYSTTAGRDWVYADLNGIFTDTLTAPGVLTVEPAADTTAPATPLDLRVTDWGADFITLAWDAVADADLYAYDLYRYGEGETALDALRVARVMAGTTEYTDTAVTSGQTYTYTVQALDVTFNKSPFSNTASATAEAKMVEVRFIVTTPAFTPADATVYIVGDQPELCTWCAPQTVALTQINATTWQRTIMLPDGKAILYKYTRGDWERTENWGLLTGFTNRELLIAYGATGVMTVTDTVFNWRDALVVATDPAQDALLWNPSGPLSVTFNRPIDTAQVTSATFVVSDYFTSAVVTGTLAFDTAVIGAYSHPDLGSGTITGTVVLFTPALPLDGGAYRVHLIKSGYNANTSDGQQMRRDYEWSFGVRRLYLPLVTRAFAP